jgi:hypothetical protein
MEIEELTYDTNPENFVLSLSDQVNITSNSKLEQIFNQFIDNDLYVYGSFDKIPHFWFCKWYNDDRISGYNRGDFFWINTSDIDSFLNDNAKQIQEYANVNPFIHSKLPNWNKSNQDIYDAYLNVLTGYHDKFVSKDLQPLWDIGNLSGPSQLLISQIDNNKHSLTETKFWKKFMITEDDRETIEQLIYSKLADTISTHVMKYHFNGIDPTQEDVNALSNYANINFGNVSDMYPKNYLENGNISKGFDIVDIYFKKPFPNRSISGEVVENVWFRKWKSGYLEHGGIINIEHYKTDDNRIVIPFGWELISENAQAYDIKYLGTGKNSILSVNVENDKYDITDNIISVLFELDRETFEIENSKNAPIYYDTNYTIQISPVFNLALDSSSNGYANMGTYSIYNNVINNNIFLSDLSVGAFSFKYNEKNTSQYYSYYVGGYFKNNER